MALLVLSLAVLAGSACSGHHPYHNHDAWHDGTYDRGSAEERYDERGPYDGGDRTTEGRYARGDWGSWLRW